MNAKPLPPIEHLNECFTYEPISGKLFWKERPRSHFRTNRSWALSNTQCSSKEAGQKKRYKDGTPSCIRVGVTFHDRFVQCQAHQIAFAIMGVVVPAGFVIDHHDGDPFNNSWINLRLATPSQNSANAKRRKDCIWNKGVHKWGNKFGASIGKDGQPIFIGSFNTPEEAHAAYCAKAVELYGEFARFN